MNVILGMKIKGKTKKCPDIWQIPPVQKRKRPKLPTRASSRFFFLILDGDWLEMRLIGRREFEVQLARFSEVG